MGLFNQVTQKIELINPKHDPVIQKLSESKSFVLIVSVG